MCGEQSENINNLEGCSKSIDRERKKEKKRKETKQIERDINQKIRSADAYSGAKILISSIKALQLCFQPGLRSSRLSVALVLEQKAFLARAQLIDLLSSPSCCCTKLLHIRRNSYWGSFVLKPMMCSGWRRCYGGVVQECPPLPPKKTWEKKNHWPSS